MVSESTIKVLVRLRPLPDGSNGSNCLQLGESDKTVSVLRDKKGVSEFTFSTGAVLGPNCKQNTIFEHCNVAQDVVDGINCCVMAYGQTSSGKTHTMYGHGWEDDSHNDLSDSSVLGVVPRSVAALFSALDSRALENEEFSFNVTCQVLQIYNERIYDLLGDKQRENPLQMRENQRKGKTRGDVASVHIPGLSAFRVSTTDDVTALLQKGLRNRAVRATDFNAVSSRSHTILQLFVETEMPDDQGLMVLRRSTFSLVDLAGSEKWRPSLDASSSKTQQILAESLRRKEQENEMVNINTSLAALGNVVSALLEPGRKHIPYRDSSLTRLLQDALGGHGRTIIIATVHEDGQYVEETFSTLSFASRASRIKVNLQVAENVSESITLESAKMQIRLLRARIQELTSVSADVTSHTAVTTSQQDLACLSANMKCPSCKDLVERVRTLIEENLLLRANVSHLGETNVQQPTSPERKGILQTMLSPLGLFKNHKVQNAPQAKPLPPSKSGPKSTPNADASVIPVSGPTFHPTATGITFPTKQTKSASQSDYESQYGLGARDAAVSSPKTTPKRSNTTNANRTSSVQVMSDDSRNKIPNGQKPQINQTQTMPQEPRTVESALAAARLALATTSFDDTNFIQDPQNNMSLQHLQTVPPTSPISSPRNSVPRNSVPAAPFGADDKIVRGSSTSFIPTRYQTSPNASPVSRASSLTASLQGSLDQGSLGSIVMQGSLDESVGESVNLTHGTASKPGRYDSSRIERIIQGSERTLDAAHKVRGGIEPSGPDYHTNQTSSGPFGQSSANAPYLGSYANILDSNRIPNSGTCAKHGLDQCVLCMMFTDRGAQMPAHVQSRNSFDYKDAKASTYGLSENSYSSTNRVQYSYSNIANMGDISPAVAAFNQSLGLPTDVKLAVGGGPSPTFGGFQRPPNNGMACALHGVRDCLLCSLKQGHISGHNMTGGNTFSLAPVKVSGYGGSTYQASSNSVRASNTLESANTQGFSQSARHTYGMYQPQPDSDDEDIGMFTHIASSNRLEERENMNMNDTSQKLYHDSETNPSIEYGRFSDYSANLDNPSNSNMLSQNKSQTRGHSVPSSSASGLYSRPPSGDDGYHNFDADVNGLYGDNGASSTRKKRITTLSANSRMQQSNTQYSSHASNSAQSRSERESDSDNGLIAKDSTHSSRNSNGIASQTKPNDYANYLYRDQPSKAVSSLASIGASSLPQLSSNKAGFGNAQDNGRYDVNKIYGVVNAAGKEYSESRKPGINQKPKKKTTGLANRRKP